MTPNQVAGWNFFRANQCSLCHAPPIFTGNGFRNIGPRPTAEDTGRQEVTGAAGDRARFKVPSLRNTGLKTRWMHTGLLASLGPVLDFYQPANGQVQLPENQDPLVPPINIPLPVRPQLIDCLANGLTDPRVANEEFPFDRPGLHSEITAEAAALADCREGPNLAPTAPTTPGQCLAQFDEDDNGDIDLFDATRFAMVYSGL